jgi:hypothetical protein
MASSRGRRSRTNSCESASSAAEHLKRATCCWCYWLACSLTRRVGGCMQVGGRGNPTTRPPPRGPVPRARHPCQGPWRWADRWRTAAKLLGAPPWLDDVVGAWCDQAVQWERRSAPLVQRRGLVVSAADPAKDPAVSRVGGRPLGGRSGRTKAACSSPPACTTITSLSYLILSISWALPLSSSTCSARTSPSTILRHRPPVTRS